MEPALRPRIEGPRGCIHYVLTKFSLRFFSFSTVFLLP